MRGSWHTCRRMQAPVDIRALTPADAAAFQGLRLRGLLECPTAFLSSHAEEVAQTVTAIAERMASNRDGAIIGAWRDGALVGMVGVQRESHAKLVHKAVIWGMYVAPEARRVGLGRAIMEAALRAARHDLRVRQVTLGVNVTNEEAIALYRRLGFETFGLERGFMMVDGELQDELHMMVVFAPTDDAKASGSPLPS